MRLPSNRISPSDSVSRPEMVHGNVLFPALLAPMVITTEPCGTSMLTPRKAATLL